MFQVRGGTRQPEAARSTLCKVAPAPTLTAQLVLRALELQRRQPLSLTLQSSPHSCSSSPAAVPAGFSMGQWPLGARWQRLEEELAYHLEVLEAAAQVVCGLLPHSRESSSVEVHLAQVVGLSTAGPLYWVR